MGRRKIEITKRTSQRDRKNTYRKRKPGLIKKAQELAILTDTKVFLSIQNGDKTEEHRFNHEHRVPLESTPLDSMSQDALLKTTVDEMSLVHQPANTSLPMGEDTMSFGYEPGLDDMSLFNSLVLQLDVPSSEGARTTEDTCHFPMFEVEDYSRHFLEYPLPNDRYIFEVNDAEVLEQAPTAMPSPGESGKT